MIRYNCTDFEWNETCSHSELICSHPNLVTRLNSFKRRFINSAPASQSNEFWNCAQHESVAGEYIRAWHIFQRSNFLLRCRASAAFLFDSRQTKMHVPAKIKVKCTFCAGSAENRGLCVHELQVLNEIASRSRYMELTGVEENVESDVGEPVV